MRRPSEVRLKVEGEVVALPVLGVSYWEDTDEEGMIVESGYVYYTPHGRVVTRLTDGGEVVLHSEVRAEVSV